MSWVALGVTAGTMVVGAYQGDQKERAQKKRNDAAAEANKYSAWTGKSMGYDYGADGAAMGGALQGGLAGFGVSQQMKTPTASATPSAGAGGYDPTYGQGQDYWSRMVGKPRNTFL